MMSNAPSVTHERRSWTIVEIIAVVYSYSGPIQTHGIKIRVAVIRNKRTVSF